MEKFCVIRPNVDAQRVKRSWKETEEEAVKHAHHLIENSPQDRRRPLFIVKVIAIVEPEPQIRVVVRQPNADDFKIEEEF